MTQKFISELAMMPCLNQVWPEFKSRLVKQTSQGSSCYHYLRILLQRQTFAVLLEHTSNHSELMNTTNLG